MKFFNRKIEQFKKDNNFSTTKEKYDDEINCYENYLNLSKRVETSMFENEEFSDDMLILDSSSKHEKNLANLKNILKEIQNKKNDYISLSLANKNNNTYRIIEALNNLQRNNAEFKVFKKINFIKTFDDVEKNIKIVDNEILLIKVSDDYIKNKNIYNKLK